MKPIPLGPFHLFEPIASGGMGAVWRAVHAEQGVPVAVKVISAHAASEEKYVTNFKNEVRSAASLDHPGIVVVLDHGEVDAAAAAASEGRLAVGSPYIAMEYASGGSLAAVRHPIAWRELKAILLTLLDALAHAHARGVVHRDIKAGNVLVCTDADQRPGLKLSDFGIAHALDWQSRSGTVESAAGTLHYMAPEQLLGHWRDYGPWTDLYSFGCLAWRLATGSVPFTGLKGAAILRAQLYHDPPALQPLRPVPAELEGWLRTLMQKDPYSRFQRAADAAWALLAMPEPRQADAEPETVLDVEQAIAGADPFTTGDPVDPDDMPTDHGELATVIGGSELLSFSGASPAPGSLRDADPAVRAPAPPPIPATWRRPIPPPASMQLVGAGLGLYGLRRISLVGREEERTLLWEALRDVHKSGAARYVLVRGPAGVGKTRLVEWICERAHELGAVQVVRAIHGTGDDPGDALSGMVSRSLRCGRLSRVDVMERVDEFLAAHGSDDEEEALALTELVAPAAIGTDRPVVRLSSATERQVVARRFLERMAGHRPVIAWFDDVHWSNEALAFTEHLLARQADSPSPVLVIHTVREESVPDDEVAARIEALLERPHARHLALDPLPMQACTELVRGLLKLDEGLAARVEERCAGNPLFAVQLVGDWVDRGVLEMGPTGFVLRPGDDAVLPDDLHQIWAARVEKVLHGLPHDARVHLELAATLGLAVDEVEWQEVCEDPSRVDRVGVGRKAVSVAGLRIRAELVDRLLSSRLAEETDAGWSFVHGMLRESLERSAREAGRWGAHNRACATMLGRTSPDASLERIGRHLVEAGELEQAITPLLDGVARAWSQRGIRPALALLVTCEQVLVELSTPGSDPRHAQVWMERARLLCLQGNAAEAAAHARRAVTAARANDWHDLLPRALYEVARAEMSRRRHADAEPSLVEVHDLCRASGDVRLLGKSLMALGIICGTRGAVDDARRLLAGAQKCFERCGADRQLAGCLGHLGAVELRYGAPEAARELLDQAVALAETTGNRNTMAEAINGHAEVLRRLGHADEAAARYERARRLYEALGSWQAVICRINIGLVKLQLGQWRDARQVIELARQTVERLDNRALLGAVHLTLLPCAAGLAEWSAWDRHMTATRAILAETGFADGDNGWTATLAGDLAAQAGEGIRAVSAYELAIGQYEAAGMEARRIEVEGRLAALRG